MICPYDLRHRMSAVPREIGGRAVFLCEALREDGARVSRCGATLVGDVRQESE